MNSFENIINDLYELRTNLLRIQKFAENERDFIQAVLNGATPHEIANEYGLTPFRGHKIYSDYISQSNAYFDRLFKKKDPLKNIFRYIFYNEPEPLPLCTPIKDLDLRLRSYKIIRYLGVKTLGDMQTLNKTMLLNVRTCGITAVRDIDREMKHRGLAQLPKK